MRQFKWPFLSKIKRFGFVGALCGLMLAAWAPATRAACIGDTGVKPALVVHVVPQFTQTQLFTQWTPLLDRVGKSAGLCFELRVAPTIFEFEQALLRGEADFAFLNPYHVVLVQRKQAYVPLLASGQSPLMGILVVKNDSSITQLNQLDGKRIAFPAPNAFSATLLTRSPLDQQKIRATPSFVASHSNVFRAVINGDVEAGGAVTSTLAREPQEVREKLRILYTTAGFVPHPVAAHPRVPPKLRAQVVAALLQLETDASGRTLLENVQLSKPVPVTYARDYKPLESLNLRKFVEGVN